MFKQRDFDFLSGGRLNFPFTPNNASIKMDFISIRDKRIVKSEAQWAFEDLRNTSLFRRKTLNLHDVVVVVVAAECVCVCACFLPSICVSVSVHVGLLILIDEIILWNRVTFVFIGLWHSLFAAGATFGAFLC